ncbi:unnamed protein product [Caenorhabditis auriculariae]|uniref:Uncharacterized protein n=1 Tax=Caenorhabditis auriculariae TaxID=2777116 RepID=A0A8S1HVW6_9PELO|nr:unnamed protein product [Caenorhabditis auriculariae]
MDALALLTPALFGVTAMFCAARLIAKACCSPSEMPGDDEYHDVRNHVFFSRIPHSYSRIVLDESANVQSVTITRIQQTSPYFMRRRGLLAHYRNPNDEPPFNFNAKTVSTQDYFAKQPKWK